MHSVHTDPFEHLAVEVCLAEWEHDLAYGLVPADAHRPLFPHERRARFNALAADNELHDLAQALTRLLVNVRATWIARIVSDLRSRATVAEAVDRIVRVDANLSVLAADLITETAVEARPILTAAVTAGAARVIGEATDQGVRTALEPGAVSRELAAEIDVLVSTVARSPIVDITGRIRQAAINAQTSDVADLSRIVAETGDRWSKATLESDFGRVPVQRGWGAARLATVSYLPVPAEIYGSELLDKRTCFTPDTLVTTATGPKRADEIGFDDQLLTHTGAFVAPSRIVVSEVAEDICVVRLQGRTMRCTRDHPVLVSDQGRFRWLTAGELTQGDLVVSEHSFEGIGEGVTEDELLFEVHDRIPSTSERGRSARIGLGPQSMPVLPVGFDDQSLADKEVDDPSTNCGLRFERNPEAFEFAASSGFDRRLRLRGDVALARAVPSAAFGLDSQRLVTVDAVDDEGRPTAYFGAVSPKPCSSPERFAAALAGNVRSSVHATAHLGAVVVPLGVRGRDLEVDLAPDADLGHTVLRASGVGGSIGHAALLRAVEGFRPASVRYDRSARQTRWVGVGETICRPARLGSCPCAANTAVSGAGEGVSAGRRLLHKNTVLEPVLGVWSEPYVGDVYDFEIPGDHTFFAEGVLVHNCDTCSDIDGTFYLTMAEARRDYPTAGYVRCRGGSRCRGTLVYIWDETDPNSFV